MIANRSPIRLLYRSGVLALSAGLAGAMFSAPATAVTLTLRNNGVSHECTLGSFTIGTGGAATAEISACTPALGGSGGSVAQPPAGPVTVTPQATPDTTPVVQGTVNLGAGETFSVTLAGKTYVGGDGNLVVTGSNWTLQVPNSAALAVGTYSIIAKLANAEGGVLVDSSTNELVIQGAPSNPSAGEAYGIGTKQPIPGVSIFVVDQSGKDGEPGATIIPGCVNEGSAENGAACRSNAFYQTTVGGQKISLTKGTVLSVRYRVQDTSSAPSTGYFQLSNPFGGNIVYPTTIWLSAEPPPSGATAPNYSPPVDAKCKVENDTRRPRITTGADYCNIDRSKAIYYLNISVQQDCTSCIFTIGESSSQLK